MTRLQEVQLYAQPVFRVAPPEMVDPASLFMLRLEVLAGDPAALDALTSGQVLEHDLAILRAGVKLLRDGRDRGFCPPYLRLSVNFRPEHFLVPDFAVRIGRILNGQRIPGRRVVIEILETGLLADTFEVRHNLKLLVRRGCKLSVDDAGTGFYSTPRQIAWAQMVAGRAITEIKLKGPQLGLDWAYHLVRAMGPGLERIVVEFVEDLIDLKFALDLGMLFPACEVAIQGNGYGAKLSEAEFRQLWLAPPPPSRPASVPA